MHTNDKIEEIKELLQGISNDTHKVLSMVQMAVPAAEGLLERVLERADQIGGLFSKEEEKDGQG